VGTKATQGTTLPIRLPTDSSSAVVSLPAAPRDAASPAHAKEAGRGPAVACARRGGGGRAADERAGGWTQAGAGCAASTPERDRKRRCAPWSPHLATRPPDESDTGQYKKQYKPKKWVLRGQVRAAERGQVRAGSGKRVRQGGGSVRGGSRALVAPCRLPPPPSRGAGVRRIRAPAPQLAADARSPPADAPDAGEEEGAVRRGCGRPRRSAARSLHGRVAVGGVASVGPAVLFPGRARWG